MKTLIEMQTNGRYDINKAITMGINTWKNEIINLTGTVGLKGHLRGSNNNKPVQKRSLKAILNAFTSLLV